MGHAVKILSALLALALLGLVSPLQAEPTEKRIALVIGNSNYQVGALQTAANDAGLIAQTLQAAGFDVVGARDLDEDSLRHAFRDFVEKASGSGPDTVALVYFAGYGLQLEGENYLVPVDANIGRDSDVPSKSVRVSDYIKPLTALQLKARIVVLDAARIIPFSISGQPLAGGLALVEPGPGMLVAFNAAPGTVAPAEKGPYGAYAQALAEMIREGGLSLGDLFDRVRLRVNEVTKGAQVPWHSSRIETSFVFFERAPDAPPPPAPAEQTSALRSKPIHSLGAQDAYLSAVERDTLQGYEEFVGAYADDPAARRVRAIIAARREAITWRRTYVADTPNAYWSYLRRYPRGPHVADARRRLAELAAALEPPPAFAMIDYDVPPPSPEEVVYVDRPVVVFDDPDFDFAPPPPLPVYFLPPPPPDFVVLPPPVVIVEAFVLPIPVFVPIPVWCHPPIYVAPPPNNVIFANIHNTVIVNSTTNTVTIRDQSGQIVSAGPRLKPGAGATAIGASLPPSVAKKAALSQSPGFTPAPTMPRQPSGKLPLGQPLPGTAGHPLPATHGTPLKGTPTGTAPTVNAPPPASPSRKPSSPSTTVHAPILPPHAPALPPPTTGQKPPSPSTTIHTPPPGAKDHKPLPSSATIHAPSPPPSATDRMRTPPSGGTGHKPPASSATMHTPLPPPSVTARKPPAPLTASRAPSPPAPGYKPLPPSSTIRRPPPPAMHSSPPAAMIHRPPPPPRPTYHAPPPPAVHSPPPAMVHQRPTPPVVHNPPPPQPTYRTPPPPTTAYRPPPSPTVRAPGPPPAVNRPPPPQASTRSCQMVNGHQVCR